MVVGPTQQPGDREHQGPVAALPAHGTTAALRAVMPLARAIPGLALLAGCDLSDDPDVRERELPLDRAPCQAASADRLARCLRDTPLGETRPNVITLLDDIAELPAIAVDLAASCTCGDARCKPVVI